MHWLKDLKNNTCPECKLFSRCCTLDIKSFEFIFGNPTPLRNCKF